MAAEWIKSSTSGVYYREHKNRKHGLRKDRYYAIRHRVDGKVKNEVLGWASEGWSDQKASDYLFELKRNKRIGEGPKTLAEKRQISIEDAQKKAKLTKEKERHKFKNIFADYIKQADIDKCAHTCRTERGYYKKWIEPTISEKTMDEITPSMLEEIKKIMNDAEKAPKTICHALALIRQVFNYAKNMGLYDKDTPVDKVKKPSRDNRRSRFLTKQEAEILLNHLKSSSEQLHDMALISLNCGLRAGEIFKLTWNNIDFEHEVLTAVDTKTKKNKNVIMTKSVIKILEERAKNSDSNGLIFVSANGTQINEISNTFSRIVEKLGFNKSIDDSRQKVVFHTLRHTYASWLVMSGVDLYTVQRLMGHSAISMTERYSHLAPDHLKKAVSMLEAKFKINTHLDSKIQSI